MRFIWNAIGIFALAAVSHPAFAAPAAVPEPGVLELAGIGAAVAIGIAWAKKRRK